MYKANGIPGNRLMLLPDVSDFPRKGINVYSAQDHDEDYEERPDGEHE